MSNTSFAEEQYFKRLNEELTRRIRDAERRPVETSNVKAPTPKLNM